MTVIKFYNNRNILLSEDDNYFNNMSKYDLYARKVNCIKEYKNKIKTYNFTFLEKLYIYYLCHNDNSIKWYFVKSDNDYEDGIPHTRKYKNKVFIVVNADIIWFDNLNKILRHEKMHVLQKIYNFDNCLKKMGCTKFMHRNDFIKSYPLLQNNPDVDNYIYKYKNKLLFSI